MAKETHYEVLQVRANADAEVIEAAFKRLAAKYHPDRNPAADATRRMQQLNDAFRILKDPRLRAAYDQQRRRYVEEERLRRERELHSQHERERQEWEREASRKWESSGKSSHQPSSADDSVARQPPPIKPQTEQPLAFALGRVLAQFFRKPSALWSLAALAICLVLASRSCASRARIFAGAPETLNVASDAKRLASVAPSMDAGSTETGRDPMKRIPGGLFMMGSPDGIGLPNEHPRHQVTVAPFDLDVTEVTVEAYTACVRSRPSTCTLSLAI